MESSESSFVSIPERRYGEELIRKQVTLQQNQQQSQNKEVEKTCKQYFSQDPQHKQVIQNQNYQNEESFCQNYDNQQNYSNKYNIQNPIQQRNISHQVSELLKLTNEQLKDYLAGLIPSLANQVKNMSREELQEIIKDALIQNEGQEINNENQTQNQGKKQDQGRDEKQNNKFNEKNHQQYDQRPINKKLPKPLSTDQLIEKALQAYPQLENYVKSMSKVELEDLLGEIQAEDKINANNLTNEEQLKIKNHKEISTQNKIKKTGKLPQKKQKIKPKATQQILPQPRVRFEGSKYVPLQQNSVKKTQKVQSGKLVSQAKTLTLDQINTATKVNQISDITQYLIKQIPSLANQIKMMRKEEIQELYDQILEQKKQKQLKKSVSEKRVIKQREQKNIKNNEIKENITKNDSRLKLTEATKNYKKITLPNKNVNKLVQQKDRKRVEKDQRSSDSQYIPEINQQISQLQIKSHLQIDRQITRNNKKLNEINTKFSQDNNKIYQNYQNIYEDNQQIEESEDYQQQELQKSSRQKRNKLPKQNQSKKIIMKTKRSLKNNQIEQRKCNENNKKDNKMDNKKDNKMDNKINNKMDNKIDNKIDNKNGEVDINFKGQVEFQKLKGEKRVKSQTMCVVHTEYFGKLEKDKQQIVQQQVKGPYQFISNLFRMFQMNIIKILNIISMGDEFHYRFRYLFLVYFKIFSKFQRSLLINSFIKSSSFYSFFYLSECSTRCSCFDAAITEIYDE